MNTLQDMLAELHFHMIDIRSAYGQVDGFPIKLVILSGAPFSLMFCFYVGKEIGPQQVTLSAAALPGAGKTDLSLEDGIVWLSLFSLTELNGSAIADSVRRIVAELKGAGFRIDSHCSKCGAPQAKLTLHDGHPVRICQPCQELEDQKFAELNRPQLGKLLVLPFSVLAAAASWATVWLVFSLCVEWLRAVMPGGGLISVSAILLLIAGFTVLMYYVGRGLGRRMPSAGMNHDFAVIISLVLSLLTVVLGNTFYILFESFKRFGVVDLDSTFKSLIHLLKTYQSAQLLFDLVLGCGLFVGCLIRAQKRNY